MLTDGHRAKRERHPIMSLLQVLMGKGLENNSSIQVFQIHYSTNKQQNVVPVPWTQSRHFTTLLKLF